MKTTTTQHSKAGSTVAGDASTPRSIVAGDDPARRAGAGDRTRRRLIACSLVAGGAAIAVSTLLKDVNSADAREVLDAVAAHPGRFEASTIAQLIGAALLVPASVGFLRLVPGRLGFAAIALLVLNALGNVGDAGMSAYILELAGHGVTGSEVGIVSAVQDGAIGSAIELMVLLGTLGFPLVAVALWRARTVPVAAPILIGAGFVAFFLPGAGEAVGGALLLGALAVCAARMLPAPPSAKLAG
jgi:hypothetical protein